MFIARMQKWLDAESFAWLIQAASDAFDQQGEDEPVITEGRVLISQDPGRPVLTMIRGRGRCGCRSNSVRPALTVIEGGRAERREGGS